MSEFLAEAQVLITPNTTKFRAELEAAISAATSKPVVVPVTAAFVGNATTQQAAQRSASEVAGAMRTQEQATRATSAATADLARIQKLSAATSADLAKSELVLATASGDIARAQLAAGVAIRQVARQEEILAAALRTGNADLIRAAAFTDLLTKARVEQTTATLAAARAEQTHGRSLDAVGTAALANTASMLGLRGAVLTAGAAFLGATVAFQAITKSIKEASDRTEEFNKTQVVFGNSAKQITDFAQTTASQLGIAGTEALKAAGIFGNLFRSIEIGPQVAADMSEALVKLASDLASFNNADPSQVLDNLRSGLVGEPEPLRKFGIFLSQVRAQQEALIETGKKQISQLTQADIVQARYNLILQDGAIAAGDFGNTQGQLANTTRTLKAEIQDLEGDLGSVLVPTLTSTAGLLTDVAKGFKVAADRAKEFKDAIPGAGSGGGGRFGFLTQSLPASLREVTAAFEVLERQSTLTFGELPSTTLRRLNDEARNSAVGVANLSDALDAGSRAARLAAFAIVSANNAIKGLGQSLNALEVQNLKIQTGLAPGGQAAEEANLRKQIQEDIKAFNLAESGSAARRKHLEDLKADQDALDQLQREAAQGAQKNSTSTKSAADKARQAQEEADQALLGLLGNRLDDAQRRAGAAAQTTSLADDIQAQNRIQALIKTQITKIRERVKDEQSRISAIRELRIAIIASRAEEKRLREEQKEHRADTASEILDIKIQIAEAKGQEALERKLLNQKIRLLKSKIAAAKGEALLQAQLRLELAQTQKQLEDLNKQQEKAQKTGKTFAQQSFDFLQTQQGFAANLLGNLIPGFATAGLVGNTATATQGPTDVGAGVQQSGALRAAETRGVRPVQVDTTNQLLRQIRDLLQGRHSKANPPEIIYNRASGSASYDTQ